MSDGGQRAWRTARPVARLRQGRNDWFRIENKSATRTAVYIYDEIGWFGVTAKDFVDELNKLETLAIDLHVNTPGGDAFDGIAIYNALKQHPATVDVIVDSLAASAGSFITQAGDSVVMTRNSQMMIHDASGLAIGNASDMAEMAGLLDKMSDNIADIYTQRAGGTVAQWRDRMRAETWYSADEAVKANLADKVQGASDTPDDSWDLSIFSYAGREAAPAPPITTPPAPVVVGSELLDALEGAFA